MFSEIFQDPLYYDPFLAAVLGAVIGLERELARKDASLRTFMLVALGSCIFTLMSEHSAVGVAGAEPSRIAAQIVTGIGFLGAGAIFRSRERISGLTTAALMWVTAGIGMCAGFHQERMAIVLTLITLFFMFSLTLLHRIIQHINPTEE